jgi:hypothetical protein
MTFRELTNFGFILLSIVILCVGILIGCYSGVDTMRQAAIEHGVAQFNPKTGDFEWLSPKKAEK